MRISVIIPSYDREAFIGRTVQSVLAQTRLPDEILVVDDGSRDNTQAVVAEYVARSEGRVRYLRRANGGVAAARNTGWQSAAPESDGLLFLDSDDLLEPAALAKMERALDAEPGAALALCRARFINADDQPVIIPNSALTDEPDDGSDMWGYLLRGNCIRTPGLVLLRRGALEQVGAWDESLPPSEDWDLWLRLAETGKPFARVPEPLLLYRVHGGNLSGNRAVMHDTGRRVYEKQLQRHAGDGEKIAMIRAHYDAFLQAVSGEPTGPSPDPVVVAGKANHLTYDAAMKKKHGRIRALIERTGVARLYRKTPMAWRLRLRTLFGIDPNA